MTLGEAKKRTRVLLDAYTAGGKPLEDKDLEQRMAGALDGAQKYVAGIKPILKTVRFVTEGSGEEQSLALDLPEDLSVPVRLMEDGHPIPGHFFSHRLLLERGGDRKLELEYEAFPMTVDEKTPESHRLELAEDACACVPIYAAATLALGDPSCDSAGLMALFQRQAAGLRIVGHGDMRVVRLV